MDKINVEIIVPSLNSQFEFLLPVVMKINVAKKLIIGVIAEAEGLNLNSDDLMLCYIDKGEELRLDISIEEAGIKDGSKLLLL